MSKINHDRSSLRYVDNLRRELANESRAVPMWYERAPELVLAGSEEDSLQRHIKMFMQLPPVQQERLNYVVECFGRYIEAQSETIAHLFAKTPKILKRCRAEQELARHELVVAGAILMQEVISDKLAHRRGVWHWYEDFYKDLSNQSKLHWSELNTILSDECLPVYAAWLFEDDPETLSKFKEIGEEQVAF